MSKLQVTIALLIAGAAAALAYRSHQRVLLSPYNIGTVRPGMRFRDADDSAKAEMKHGYTCRAAGGGVQICDLVTDGPIGKLTHVVDASGRIALVQFLISDNTQRTRDLGSMQLRQWSRISPDIGPPSESSSDVNLGQWRSADSLWSAELTWRRSADAPGRMTSSDERRLRQIAKDSPDAFARLVRDSLLDSRDLASAASLASSVGAAAGTPPEQTADDASTAAAAAETDASSASSLPQCSGEKTSVALAAGTDSNSMEPALWTVAQQAIARAYPGMHLDPARRGALLTDASGASEEIALYPNASTATGDLYAFAVTFPQRIKEAASHASTFDTANQCRATSEILLARVDPATHTVTDLQRVGVDDESLFNAIGAVDFVPTADAPPRLIVEYLASYGTATWYGQVRWNELVAADSLRLVKRSPVSYAKKLPNAPASGGPLVTEDTRRDDPYGLSYEPGTLLHFSTLNLGARAPVRHVTLMTGDGELPNGWALLSQL